MSYLDCLACKDAGTTPVKSAGVKVVYDPQILRSGTPTIEGRSLAADFIAARVYKYGVESEMADYQLSREEVLAACWWTGLYSRRKVGKVLHDWSREAGRHLWYGCTQIADPPREGPREGE